MIPTISLCREKSCGSEIDAVLNDPEVVREQLPMPVGSENDARNAFYALKYIDDSYRWIGPSKASLPLLMPAERKRLVDFMDREILLSSPQGEDLARFTLKELLFFLYNKNDLYKEALSLGGGKLCELLGGGYYRRAIDSLREPALSQAVTDGICSEISSRNCNCDLLVKPGVFERFQDPKSGYIDQLEADLVEFLEKKSLLKKNYRGTIKKSWIKRYLNRNYSMNGVSSADGLQINILRYQNGDCPNNRHALQLQLYPLIVGDRSDCSPTAQSGNPWAAISDRLLRIVDAPLFDRPVSFYVWLRTFLLEAEGDCFPVANAECEAIGEQKYEIYDLPAYLTRVNDRNRAFSALFNLSTTLVDNNQITDLWKCWRVEAAPSLYHAMLAMLKTMTFEEISVIVAAAALMEAASKPAAESRACFTRRGDQIAVAFRWSDSSWFVVPNVNRALHKAPNLFSGEGKEIAAKLCAQLLGEEEQEPLIAASPVSLNRLYLSIDTFSGIVDCLSSKEPWLQRLASAFLLTAPEGSVSAEELVKAVPKILRHTTPPSQGHALYAVAEVLERKGKMAGALKTVIKETVNWGSLITSMAGIGVPGIAGILYRDYWPLVNQPDKAALFAMLDALAAEGDGHFNSLLVASESRYKVDRLPILEYCQKSQADLNILLQDNGWALLLKLFREAWKDRDLSKEKKEEIYLDITLLMNRWGRECDLAALREIVEPQPHQKPERASKKKGKRPAAVKGKVKSAAPPCHPFKTAWEQYQKKPGSGVKEILTLAFAKDSPASEEQTLQLLKAAVAALEGYHASKESLAQQLAKGGSLLLSLPPSIASDAFFHLFIYKKEIVLGTSRLRELVQILLKGSEERALSLFQSALFDPLWKEEIEGEKELIEWVNGLLPEPAMKMIRKMSSRKHWKESPSVLSLVKTVIGRWIDRDDAIDYAIELIDKFIEEDPEIDAARFNLIQKAEAQGDFRELSRLVKRWRVISEDERLSKLLANRALVIVEAPFDQQAVEQVVLWLEKGFFKDELLAVTLVARHGRQMNDALKNKLALLLHKSLITDRGVGLKKRDMLNAWGAFAACINLSSSICLHNENYQGLKFGLHFLFRALLENKEDFAPLFTLAQMLGKYAPIAASQKDWETLAPVYADCLEMICLKYFDVEKNSSMLRELFALHIPLPSGKVSYALIPWVIPLFPNEGSIPGDAQLLGAWFLRAVTKIVGTSASYSRNLLDAQFQHEPLIHAMDTKSYSDAHWLYLSSRQDEVKDGAEKNFELWISTISEGRMPRDHLIYFERGWRLLLKGGETQAKIDRGLHLLKTALAGKNLVFDVSEESWNVAAVDFGDEENALREMDQFHGSFLTAVKILYRSLEQKALKRPLLMKLIETYGSRESVEEYVKESALETCKPENDVEFKEGVEWVSQLIDAAEKAGMLVRTGPQDRYASIHRLYDFLALINCRGKIRWSDAVVEDGNGGVRVDPALRLDEKSMDAVIPYRNERKELLAEIVKNLLNYEKVSSKLNALYIQLESLASLYCLKDEGAYVSLCAIIDSLTDYPALRSRYKGRMCSVVEQTADIIGEHELGNTLLGYFFNRKLFCFFTDTLLRAYDNSKEFKDQRSLLLAIEYPLLKMMGNERADAGTYLLTYYSRCKELARRLKDFADCYPYEDPVYHQELAALLEKLFYQPEENFKLFKSEKPPEVILAAKRECRNVILHLFCPSKQKPWNSLANSIASKEGQKEGENCVLLDVGVSKIRISSPT